MTTFDELVGAEPTGAERDRLRSVHALLLEAGPPPELTPEVESGPTTSMTLGRTRQRMSGRRRMLIPAIAAAVLLALFVALGVTGGNDPVVTLRGTKAAPQASGTLTILHATATVQPMEIDVRGLQAGQYCVYLVRKGHPWAECGTFSVADGNIRTEATFNSPYRVWRHDSWVVTQQVGRRDKGVTVLVPPTV
jgi:hypothetical protein